MLSTGFHSSSRKYHDWDLFGFEIQIWSDGNETARVIRTDVCFFLDLTHEGRSDVCVSLGNDVDIVEVQVDVPTKSVLLRT